MKNYKDIDTIVLDMDGTIADLYGSKNWLEKIINEKPVFTDLQPLVDIKRLDLLLSLLSEFCTIKIITWLPMNATFLYKQNCRLEKILWIKRNLTAIDKIHAIKYGAKKHYVRNISKNALLFDDNKQVRFEWNNSGRVAKSEKNILNDLEKILLQKMGVL